MNEHPLVRMNVLLSDNEPLVQMMNDIREKKTDDILIFTFDLPDDYQKISSAPFMRLTEIYLHNTFYNDDESAHYRFLFAVEVFGVTMNDTHKLSNEVIKIIKQSNGRCYDRFLDKDDELNIYHNMLKFEIILNEEG